MVIRGKQGDLMEDNDLKFWVVVCMFLLVSMICFFLLVDSEESRYTSNFDSRNNLINYQIEKTKPSEK